MTLECLRQRARQSDPKHEENRVGWALKAVQNGFEMFLSRSSNGSSLYVWQMSASEYQFMQILVQVMKVF